MKVKNDFITNSSSAAFVLSLSVDGRIPNIENMDLRSHFINLGYAVALKTGYFDYGYCSYLFHISHEKDYNVNNPDRCYPDVVEYQLDLTRIYDENDKNAIEISLLTENVNYNYRYNLEMTKHYAAKIVQDLINLFPKSVDQQSKMFMRIQPINFNGDGWNGDPMGPYHQISEAVEKETKFGQLIVKDNKLQFQLYDLLGNVVVKGPSKV